MSEDGTSRSSNLSDTAAGDPDPAAGEISRSDIEPSRRNAKELSQKVARAFRTHEPLVLLLLSLTLAAAVYFPLTRVYFRSDDFSNLDTIVNRGGLYFIVEPFAGHMGFARNTQFYLLYLIFGATPEPYGWLALITHLINVFLLFRVGRRLTGSVELAALGAALWGTCPLLVGAIGWYSVYGQALSSTLFLLVLDRIVRLPDGQDTLSRRTVLSWSLLLLVGATCFGTGIAIVIVAPLALALLVKPPLSRRDVFATFLPLPLIVACMYYGWQTLFAYFEPAATGDQALHSPGLDSLGPVFSMLAHLFAVGTSGLLQNLWFVPNGDPIVVWWLVGAFVAGVIGAFVLADRNDKQRMIGLLLLSLAAYGLTALARANLYLMFDMPPAHAAKQIRYHYFATIPLALILLLALKQALVRIRHQRPVLAGVLAAWVIATACFVVTTNWRISEFSDCRQYVSSSMREIDSRIDAQPPGSEVYIPNQDVPVFCTGIMGHDRIPGWAGLFALFHEEDLVRGRRVRFVEQKQHRGQFSDPKHERFSKLLIGR